MKRFFLSLPSNVIGCFKGRLVFWHLTFIALTLLLVVSGFDWWYYCSMRPLVVHPWWHPALWLGMFLPALVPLGLILAGFVLVRPKVSLVGWTLGQAALIGWFISSVYKFFTGRMHPAHIIGENISREFRLGFYRGGIFWGWPSSHTTVAFAMAVTILMLFPKHRLLKWLALACAFYIGLSVSMTIHWFSDFVAGTILGCVVGVVVGRNFRTEQTRLIPP